MIIHKYIFSIIDGSITTYCYEDNKFMQIRYEGDDSFTLSDQSIFWRWWERNAGYGKNDEIDFCCVSNPEPFTFVQNYKQLENSTWTIEEIKSFLTLLPYSNIKLIQEGLTKKISVNKQSLKDIYQNSDFTDLYLSVYPRKKLLLEQNNVIVKENVEIIEPEGVLYRYYRAKTEELKPPNESIRTQL